MITKKENKKENKKEIIINIAFEEWGNTFFKNTSLSLIMNKLDVTKPAFYRHFKSKILLLDAMKDKVLLSFKLHLESFINNSFNKIKPEDLVSFYIEEMVFYFSKNYNYLLFYVIYMVRNNLTFNTKLEEFTKKINRIFEENFKKSGMNNFNGEEVNFIFFTIIFLFINYFKDKLGTSSKILLTEEEIKNINKTVFDIVSKGFIGEKFNLDLDFETVENKSNVKGSEIPQLNRFFGSIASVIASDGLWETSIKKIADNLGMAKSSLYFHFNNKNQMISKMILEEIDKINTLIENKNSSFSSIEEKLYSSIVAIASYFNHQKEIMRVFDWLHFQGFDFESIKDQIEKINILKILVNEGVKQNKISLNNLTDDDVSVFLRILVMKEVLVADITGKNIEITNIRKLYHLFLKGIYHN